VSVKRITTAALILGLALVSMFPEAVWAWVVLPTTVIAWIAIRAVRREL